MAVRRLNEEFDERDSYYIEQLDKICQEIIPRTEDELIVAMNLDKERNVIACLKKLRQNAEYLIEMVDDLTPPLS